jgi:hypothetical protein
MDRNLRGVVNCLSVAVLLLSVIVLPGGTANSSPAGSRTLWVHRYDGPGHGDDAASAVAVSPDATRVIVTGSSLGLGFSDYATVAYDSSGHRRWTARYDGPVHDNDAARVVAVSPDSKKVFVTGRSAGGDSEPDYVTVAYDAASGHHLWTSRYDTQGDSQDSPAGLAVSPDGSKVFVTGDSGINAHFVYMTIAYDANTGHILWVDRYNGPTFWDFAKSLTVSPDSSTVFVTGGSQSIGAGSDDFATIAYDAGTGLRLWITRYDHAIDGGDFARAIGVSPDGSAVFVTGESQGRDSYRDYLTIAYDARTGHLLWKTRYDDPAQGEDYPRAIASSPDGSAIFVTGYGLGTGYDYVTVAYDAATGHPLWTKGYDGPGGGTDQAYSLAASRDGSMVFVTGYSTGPLGMDYATIAYDAGTGHHLWTKRYNGPEGPDGNDDAASSLATSADGTTVFVTGRSDGLGGNYDYATIAYSTGPGASRRCPARPCGSR